ncbi:hypothetical protein NDU88_002448 [Pleurodeles waltl]|uniref:Uncharacterized protein n=1 Tax=Pleurodeles waltl TaxID=8319 RepID=A0AAV7MQJ9_PLEWA|nr:hypothetical protein NDU88_002448 [Pleurodeles waltl]
MPCPGAEPRPLRPEQLGPSEQNRDNEQRVVHSSALSRYRCADRNAVTPAGTPDPFFLRPILHPPRIKPDDQRGKSVRSLRRNRGTEMRQLLQVARKHGPFRIDKYEVCIMADYSKDTNERRKAFLALRSRLRQLEMKYGLFDPARMWVTKNGESKDFYNP